MTDVINGRKAWLVVGLLFLCQAINYFDKTVLGLAATFIMADLGLTPKQYGFVASSFFSLYAISGVIVGLFVAGRVRSKLLLSLLVLVWALAQLPVLLLPGFATLLFSRVLLGAGEGPTNPTAISIAHGWFSSDLRNMPSATIMLGGTVGSLVAAPLLTYVIAGFGWRAGFAFCALLSMIWLVVWLVFGADPPLDDAAVTEARQDLSPDRSIWTDPTIIGQLITGFCAYWTITFVVTWVPPMLTAGMGFAPVQTGWLITAMQGLTALILVGSLWLSQRAVRRGATSRQARGLVMAWTMFAAAAALIAAPFVGNVVVKLALIAIGGALPTITATLGTVVISEVTPPAQRSRVLITIASLLTLAGLIGPLATGFLVGDDKTSGYGSVLLLNGVVALVGSIVAFILLNPEKSRRRRAAMAAASGG